jgi:hypothetical protein
VAGRGPLQRRERAAVEAARIPEHHRLQIDDVPSGECLDLGSGHVVHDLRVGQAWVQQGLRPRDEDMTMEKELGDYALDAVTGGTLEQWRATPVGRLGGLGGGDPLPLPSPRATPVPTGPPPPQSPWPPSPPPL